MIKNKLHLLFILLISIGLVACGGDSDGASKPTESSDPVENNDGSSNKEEASNDYPNRDIEILVGHGAGGGTDNFARQIAKQMEEILGVNINVVIQEGAGGVIAKENGANAPADGYTIVATSSLPIQVAIGSNTDNELNVYMPIARIQSDTMAFQTMEGAYDDIDDFLETVKNNPGTIRVGSTGVGTPDDIIFRMFTKETGLDMIFVPFEGAGKMHAALLGGHIDVMLEEVGPVASMVEAGEIHTLMFFTEERIEEFPDVPTTVEKGWDITNGVERGLLLRNDVPQEIIDKLEETVKEAMETDEYKEYEKNSYLHLREGWLGSKDYYDKLKSDIEIYSEFMAE